MNKPGEPKNLQDQIEKNLKKVFDDIAQEEVPDRFKDLLAQLRASEGKKDVADGE